MKKDKGFEWEVKSGQPWPMGVTRQGTCVNICIENREQHPLSLLLYHPGEVQACHRLAFEETDRFGSLYCAALEDFPIEAYEYTFQIGEQEYCDPYAGRICGREQFGRPHAYIRSSYCPSDFDWEDDVRPRIPYNQGILYTAHVRGMTMDASSGVKAAVRGTFAGIRERIPYLQALGINMLELMPAYEFEEVIPRKISSMAYYTDSRGQETPDRLNYWGYGAGNYFAPKESYAAGEDAAGELKTLVKELHRAGIELILEFYFPEHTYPGLVLECLRYWTLQYHVDGFHISGTTLPMQWIAREPLLAEIKLMSGNMQPEEIYESGERLPFKNLAEYNDGCLTDMRRFLKGEENQVGAFAFRAKKNPARCGVINYMASHNGFTLADMVSYEEKHNEENGEDNRDGSDYNFSCNYSEEGKSRKRKVNELRLRQMKNALLMVFLSQGTPCIMAGDECGNSQNGNNNAYCLDTPTAWVNYGTGKRADELREFLRRVIAFRLNHPIFHQPEELKGVDYHSCGYPDISYHGKNVWYPQMEGGSRQLGILYCGAYAADGYFYVAYNMHPEAKEFALPNLPKGMKWHYRICTGKTSGYSFYGKEEETLLADQKSMCLEGRTVAVLQGIEEQESGGGRRA